MSVTTWKTTSPSWVSKVSGILFCVRKKPVVEQVDEEEAPELDEGIGNGLTAHEVIQQYKAKKKGSFGDNMSIKSLLGGKDGTKDDGLLKEAAAIKKKNTPKVGKGKAGDRESKTKKIIRMEMEKERVKEKEQKKKLFRSNSEQETMDWLMQPFKEDEDEGDEEEDGEKAVKKALNLDENDEEEEDDENKSRIKQEKDNGSSRMSKDRSNRDRIKSKDLGKLRVVGSGRKLNKKGKGKYDSDSESEKSDYGINMPKDERKKPKMSMESNGTGDSDAEFSEFIKSVNKGGNASAQMV